MMIQMENARSPRRMAQRGALLLVVLMMITAVMGSLALASSAPEEQAKELVERWISELGEEIMPSWNDPLSPEVTDDDISISDTLLIGTTTLVNAFGVSFEELAEYVPSIWLNTFVDGRREWNATFAKPSPSGVGFTDSFHVTLDSLTGDVLFFISGGRG